MLVGRVMSWPLVIRMGGKGGHALPLDFGMPIKTVRSIDHQGHNNLLLKI